jgi:PAS domain S-box-containing protein
LEAGRMGVWDWDVRTGALAWSDNLEPIHGLTPGTFGGTIEAFRDLIHPEDRDSVLQAISRSLEEQSGFDVEFRTVRPDGGLHWMSGKGKVFSERGWPVRLIGVGIDITGRRQAEEQVRFQAHLLDAVGQAVIVTDPEGRVIYWNRYAERLYGWSAAEATGRSILDLVVAPESAGRAAEIMGRMLTGEGWSGEFVVRRRDGTTFPALVTDTPVFDDRGTLEAVIGVSSDISERKRAEEMARFLADASAALAGLVDEESTLQTVARLTVPAFADWCAVDLRQADGSLRRVAVAHVDPSKVELAHEVYRRYPPDPEAPQGVWSVLRSGRSEIVPEITDEVLVATVKDGELLRILRELGLRSYLGVPLAAREEVLGVVTFIAA